MISAHNLVVLSYDLDPMLKEKYQTLKQNIYNEIATYEVMLEPHTGQLSDCNDGMGEEIENPLDLKVTPPMEPTEKEFRERLDGMERDDEVPTHINPETIGEKDFYYLLIKRHRTVSNMELLNHMYGAVQAIGNLDVDTIVRSLFSNLCKVPYFLQLCQRSLFLLGLCINVYIATLGNVARVYPRIVQGLTFLSA